jgi:hypothetical protein
MFKHVDSVYGAQHQARFKAEMAPSRELHEADKVAGDAVQHKLLKELLAQPVAEKPKKAAKKEARCDHGRRKRQCKDCGTGSCQHGRRKGQCKDCGTGRCKHGRDRNKCKNCGTGQCQHGLWKSQCKDCGNRQ